MATSPRTLDTCLFIASPDEKHTRDSLERLWLCLGHRIPTLVSSHELSASPDVSFWNDTLKGLHLRSVIVVADGLSGNVWSSLHALPPAPQRFVVGSPASPPPAAEGWQAASVDTVCEWLLEGRPQFTPRDEVIEAAVALLDRWRAGVSGDQKADRRLDDFLLRTKTDVLSAAPFNRPEPTDADRVCCRAYDAVLLARRHPHPPRLTHEQVTAYAEVPGTLPRVEVLPGQLLAVLLLLFSRVSELTPTPPGPVFSLRLHPTTATAEVKPRVVVTVHHPAAELLGDPKRGEYDLRPFLCHEKWWTDENSAGMSSSDPLTFSLPVAQPTTMP